MDGCVLCMPSIQWTTRTEILNTDILTVVSLPRLRNGCVENVSFRFRFFILFPIQKWLSSYSHCRHHHHQYRFMIYCEYKLSTGWWFIISKYFGTRIKSHIRMLKSTKSCFIEWSSVTHMYGVFMVCAIFCVFVYMCKNHTCTHTHRAKHATNAIAAHISHTTI